MPVVADRRTPTGADAGRCGREGTLFLRFCVVGAAGFAIDAACLWFLLNHTPLGPIPARAVSFVAAILATWTLNRRWAFTAYRTTFWRGLVRYVSVQGMGLGCNFLVYAGGLYLLPPPLNAPLAALTLASAAALSVNYLGLRLAVFRVEPAPGPPQDSWSGHGQG